MRQKLTKLHLPIAALCLTLPTLAPADLLQDELDQFIGRKRCAVIKRFGPAQLDSPDRLLYVHDPSFKWSGRRLPTPHGGSRQNGVSGDMELPEIGHDGCAIEVLLGEDNRVTAMKYAGPGCFIFIHQPR